MERITITVLYSQLNPELVIAEWNLLTTSTKIHLPTSMSPCQCASTDVQKCVHLKAHVATPRDAHSVPMRTVENASAGRHTRAHVHIHMWPRIYLYTGTRVSKHTSAWRHMHRGYFDNTANSSSSKHCRFLRCDPTIVVKLQFRCRRSWGFQLHWGFLSSSPSVN